MILTKKRRLRLGIRQQTALLSRQEKLRQSKTVFSILEKTTVFRKSRNIGFFWSLTDEIPTQDVIRKWAGRKNIFLPRTEGDGMHFVWYTEGCEMEEGDFRILVPAGAARIDPAELDIIIVPGVAFDSQGRRLGKGKGYYDRFMELYGNYTVGVCFHHQLIAEVPSEPHDRRVDMMVSPGGLLVITDTVAEGEQAEGVCSGSRNLSLKESLA
ncbi:MAG: 5-formyltetrahydrofolate cyclo-ligase [Rikenellaceae bacterium]|nr:5-formyltetrahydrofolate cyclo-ligase [Rikenellaceae bacterium]